MSSATDAFRRQHDELLQVVGEMQRLFDVGRLATDANAARTLLSQLEVGLRVHLLMEDRAMYPKLTSHEDPTIAGIAKRYRDEMGGLTAAFGAYTKRWSTAGEIQRDAAGFISESKAIFDALRTRIERENDDLYALVDRVGL